MNMHKNARLTPRGRERIVRQVASGQTPEAVAEAAGICPRTVRKWVDRHRREGLAGFHDPPFSPHCVHPTPPPAEGLATQRLLRQPRGGDDTLTPDRSLSLPPPPGLLCV